MDPGRLRAAVEGIKEFDREAMSLPALCVEPWGPWVFATADPNATCFCERVGELSRGLEATGWDRLRFVGAKTWDLACNWKVYVDNYLDGGYHIPHMHPSLDAQIDMASYRTEVFSDCSIQESGAGAGPGAARIGDRAIYAWLHPNFIRPRAIRAEGRTRRAPLSSPPGQATAENA